ncbi:MAG: hypothetical protein WDO73_04500 [Ignavibacteriota bacterium]
MSIGSQTLLAYRSNQSIDYTSSVYSATQTTDSRYGGTTTIDTRNAAKIALRGKLADFQTYVYDAGSNGVRTNNDRIARDTIGLFLTPDTADPGPDSGAGFQARQCARGFYARFRTGGFHHAVDRRKDLAMSDYSIPPLDLLTANRQKGYVGLHIQQGVPVLDRDLNLLQDLITATVRSVITRYIGNGAPANADGFGFRLCPRRKTCRISISQQGHTSRHVHGWRNRSHDSGGRHVTSHSRLWPSPRPRMRSRIRESISSTSMYSSAKSTERWTPI